MKIMLSITPYGEPSYDWCKAASILLIQMRFESISGMRILKIEYIYSLSKRIPSCSSNKRHHAFKIQAAEDSEGISMTFYGIKM